MDLKNFSDNLARLHLPNESKTALVSIINDKIENDMEKTLLEMRKENAVLFQKLESDKQELKTEIRSFSASVNVIKWVFSVLLVIVGIIGSVIIYLLSSK